MVVTASEEQVAALATSWKGEGRDAPFEGAVMVTPPVDAEDEGDGEEVGPVGEGDGDGAGLGEGEGDGEGVGLGDGEGEGLGDGEGEGLGDGDGAGLGEGVGTAGSDTADVKRGAERDAPQPAMPIAALMSRLRVREMFLTQGIGLLELKAFEYENSLNGTSD